MGDQRTEKSRIPVSLTRKRSARTSALGGTHKTPLGNWRVLLMSAATRVMPHRTSMRRDPGSLFSRTERHHPVVALWVFRRQCLRAGSQCLSGRDRQACAPIACELRLRTGRRALVFLRGVLSFRSAEAPRFRLLSGSGIAEACQFFELEGGVSRSCGLRASPAL